jgi:hypothetical protein
MGMNQIEELNQKRLEKRQEVEIFLSNLSSITNHREFNSNIKEIIFELKGLIDKFSRDTLKISLLSEISSGKSTFLNALVFKQPILESKIGETTTKLFHIKYGEEHTIDGVKKENIEELKAEIASQNSKNLKAIMQDKELSSIQSVITLPNENLKKGIELYDTPGFAAIKEKRIIALLKEVISKSDVTILLLDISQGIKESEHLFIRNMFKNIQINKRFIVLNKYDTIVNEDDLILKSKEEIKEEIDTLIEGIEETLQKLQKDTNQKIESHYLSAKKALVAKIKEDTLKLEESRFPIFEEVFWKRVVEAKDELLEDNIQIFNLLKIDVNKILKEEKLLLQREKSNSEFKITTSVKNQNSILALKKDIETLKILNSNTQERQQKLEREMHKLIEDILYILKTNLSSKLTTITYFHKIQFWSLKKRYTKIILSVLEDANSYIIQQINNFISRNSKDRKEMNALLWSINKNIKELLITPEYDNEINLERIVNRIIMKIEKNIQWNGSTLFALLQYNIVTNDSKILEPSYFELKQEILGVKKATSQAINKRENERRNCILLVENEMEKMLKSVEKKEVLQKNIDNITLLIEKIDLWF